MGNGSYGHWSMALLLGFLVSFHAPQAYAGDVSLAPPPQVEVLLADARQNFDFMTPVVCLRDTAWKSDLLVDALIQVESAGQPRCVGAHGERGLMQIKQATWDQMSLQVFGAQIPFDMAFDPDLNRLLGRAYLTYLSDYLAPYRARWRADERTLLLACYNYGPDRVRAAGFNPAQLPGAVMDYARRISDLHDDYLRRSAAPAEVAMIGTPRLLARAGN
jgi:hypothetical protein